MTEYYWIKLKEDGEWSLGVKINGAWYYAADVVDFKELPEVIGPRIEAPPE